MSESGFYRSIHFPVKKVSDGKRTLVLKKIRFYNCVLIYVKNVSLVIRTKDNCFNIHPYSLCFIEKNTVVDASINVLGAGVPYEIYHINSDVLKYVCKTMEPVLLDHRTAGRKRDKVLFYQAGETDANIFNRLVKSHLPSYRQIYKITYLLSKIPDIESLMYSLEVSIETTFTEKVKSIIESDISKTWRLVDLSEHLHMSEISIRKKLDIESSNFNTILLDIRMHAAARMITTTEKHINSIAYDTGYTSTSYFIKMFKSYFGITPKQFSLKVKRG